MSSEGGKHPLKSKWLISYIPQPDPNEKDYDEACRRLWRHGDHVSTIEELWSALNSMPQFPALPPRDQMFLSRGDEKPFYRFGTEGGRISIFTESKAMGESALDSLIIAIVGEGVTTVCDGRSVVDVIRWARKPSMVCQDALHIEIWLNDGTFKDAVFAYIKSIVQKAYPNTKVMDTSKK